MSAPPPPTPSAGGGSDLPLRFAVSPIISVAVPRGTSSEILLGEHGCAGRRDRCKWGELAEARRGSGGGGIADAELADGTG